MLPVSPRLSDSGVHTVWGRSQWWPLCTTLCHTAYGDNTPSEDPGAPVDLDV